MEGLRPGAEEAMAAAEVARLRPGVGTLGVDVARDSVVEAGRDRGRGAGRVLGTAAGRVLDRLRAGEVAIWDVEDERERLGRPEVAEPNELEDVRDGVFGADGVRNM